MIYECTYSIKPTKSLQRNTCLLCQLNTYMIDKMIQTSVMDQLLKKHLSTRTLFLNKDMHYMVTCDNLESIYTSIHLLLNTV